MFAQISQSSASIASAADSQTPPFAIKTQGITKKYGNQTVVSNLNIAIPQGRIYGFLGPNGARA